METILNQIKKNVHKVRKTIIIFSSQNKQTLYKVASTKHLIELNKQNLHKIGCNQPNKSATVNQKKPNIKKILSYSIKIDKGGESIIKRIKTNCKK